MTFDSFYFFRHIDKLNTNFIYLYDAMGHRIAKHMLDNSEKVVSMYYVLDAQGNPMSTYQIKMDAGEVMGNYMLQDRSIYGSKRLGLEDVSSVIGIGLNKWEEELSAADHLLYTTAQTALSSQEEVNAQGTYRNTLITGDKRYELSNHLGNVLNVITDRKIAVPNADLTTVDHYTAQVVSYSDYFPFGMQMPGRHGSVSEYRYSFNGKEKDDEIKGNGNSIDFGARIYDPRIGRWLSRDPLETKYPYLTPYNFSGNNPIMNADPDGKDIIDFMTLNSGKTKNTFKVLTSSSVYMSWLGNFADVNNNPESVQLGFGNSGSRRDINLAFSVQKLPEGTSGTTEMTFKGKSLSDCTVDELGGAKMDDFQILITISDDAGIMNAEALLTTIHESGLHAESQAKILDQFQSGQINTAQLIEKYKELSSGEGEKDHLEITSQSNSTYESMVSDAKIVLKDVTTNTNRVVVMKVNDQPGMPGSANRGLMEAYGKYSPTKNTPNAWKNHYVNLYEMFSYEVDFHKEHQYNPEKRGMPLNALPSETTIKE